MSDKKRHLPKAAIYILIAIAVFLPTLLAVASLIYADYIGANEKTRASEVILLDSNGNELFREHESDGLSGDESLISIFNVLYRELDEVSAIPSEVLDISPLTALITDINGTHTLECHFPMDGSVAYCTDKNNSHYAIRASDCERFLVSVYSQSLYTNSVPPNIKTSDGEIITPSSASWHYKNIDNDFVEVVGIKTSQEALSYTMTGDVGFDFSMLPDDTEVLIYQDGDCIFDGPWDELNSLILVSGSDVNIKLTARWYNKRSLSYYGTLTYDFNVNIHSRAQFSVSREFLGVGDFITVTATNIYDASKLKFTAKDSDFSPQILLQGTTAYMLIPYTVCDGQDSFDFTVSYGVSSSPFTIKYKEGGLTKSDIEKSQEIFAFTPREQTSSTSQYLFLGGKSVLPNEEMYQKSISFGQSFTYFDDTPCAFFNEYTARGNGYSVCAVLSGKVAQAGTHDILGKYIVVDMGAGLRVWYFGLSVLDVRVDEYVAAGDVLGKCGTLPTSTQDGFLLALSCHGDIVDINALLNE